jgi:hypothetical protein
MQPVADDRRVGLDRAEEAAAAAAKQTEQEAAAEELESRVQALANANGILRTVFAQIKPVRFGVRAAMHEMEGEAGEGTRA